MSFSVIYFFLTRFDAPFAPRGDYLHIRRKRLYGKLKADLVVAFAGAAVAYSVRAFRQSYFYDPFGYYRTRKRRTEHIFFIKGASLYRRDDEIVYEFLRQIFYIKL